MKDRKIDDPFDKDLWAKAEEIALNYHIAVKPVGGKNKWRGDCLEMYTVSVFEEDSVKCYEKMREALTVTVATMLEMGNEPPKPIDN
ncbi:MAG: hypothetical protein GY845_25740 [Planctomycetes bacterium]|nr:hypothetical protein [Planctomycetota bacterium]